MTLNLDQTKHFANKKEKAENPEENNKEQEKKSEKLELGSGAQFVCVLFSCSLCWIGCVLMNEYSYFPSYAKQQTFTQISPKNQRKPADMPRGREK